jgi:hypothetical protein
MWYSDVCVRRGGWRLVWAGGEGEGEECRGRGGSEGMRWNAEHSGPRPPPRPPPPLQYPRDTRSGRTCVNL